MAANLIPCVSNCCLAPCSFTSCALQYGHQSAERKKRSTVPFGLFRLSLDNSCPNWSRAVKSGIFRPTFEPVTGEAKGKEEDLCELQPNPNKQRENIRISRVFVFNACLPRSLVYHWPAASSRNAPDP